MPSLGCTVGCKATELEYNKKLKAKARARKGAQTKTAKGEGRQNGKGAEANGRGGRKDKDKVKSSLTGKQYGSRKYEVVVMLAKLNIHEMRQSVQEIKGVVQPPATINQERNDCKVCLMVIGG